MRDYTGERGRTSVRKGHKGFAKDAKGHLKKVFFCALCGIFASFAYGSPLPFLRYIAAHE